MRNALTIAAFEFRTRVRRISTWVYFTIFFALALMWAAAAGGAITGAIVSFGSGKVWINSPYAVAQTVSFLGMVALTVIAAVMGRAVQQDFEYRTEAFFFTAPIRRAEYLAGRFVGAVAVLFVILASIGLGAAAGLLLPGIDPDRVGPFRVAAYVAPYFTMLLPNIVVLGGMFFCAAALTRRMLPVYVGSVLILIGYLAAQGLLRDIDNKLLASLIDPFGLLANSRLTEYWSISEKNTRAIPFESYLLWNRMLWLGVAAAVIAVCLSRFTYGQQEIGGRKARSDDGDAANAPAPVAARTVDAAAVNPWRLLPRMIWLNFRETVKNVYFGVIALAGVLFFISTSTTAGSIFGTTTWPVTWQMLELVSGTFGVFMLVIVTFYAGELVWRERENRLDQIHDALPIPTWLPFAAKLGALLLIPVVLQVVLLSCGIGVQTAKGYHHYEIGLYVRWLFGIELIDYWLVCVLALTVHSLVNQKYLGHFLMIVYFIAISFAPLLGFEHNLYKYGVTGGFTYSDMNGFGHFLTRLRFFQAYWAAAAVLLAVAGYLFWVRGTTADWKGRLRIARRRLDASVATVAALGALAMAGLGAFIFYNTNILNPYLTTRDLQARQAEYEKKYKLLAGQPQPKITAVKLTVDLYPREQRVRMKGRYTLENRSGAPIGAIHLLFFQGDRRKIHTLEFATPAELATDDLRIGVRSYRLATPMAPGATTELTFDLEAPAAGFMNSGSVTDVVYNGSFVNGQTVLPIVGYQERGELTTDRDRKKFGLAPKERMRDRDDPAGLAENGLATDADFISFEAIVGTDEDQWAIAPGYLQREWKESGRHYFEYRMDSPILNFYAFQSARYAVKKDRWNDVAIEIYYQPGHEYNLDRMVAATKAGLDYFGAAFGPYQHKQFRIIEFPRYQAFAQSFPNTIPYSEGIGFIARVRDTDPDDIDYPYYVTAHELAHQWWGHQVPGGNVQGETLLVETLAQYSALMVMKKKYGAEKMKRFLHYELDNYLKARGFERYREMPLCQNCEQQYIHYNKGSLVMYALQDYVGEENLNRALARFIKAKGYQEPPYTNSLELLEYIREITPKPMAYLVEDMFEKITTYENRAVSATYKELGNQKYEVHLSVESKKLYTDDYGVEKEAPLNDLIDIGVLDADGKPLYLEKREIKQASTDFTIVVDHLPAQAGIDPMNKLIDRRPDDNVVRVTKE